MSVSEELLRLADTALRHLEDKDREGRNMLEAEAEASVRMAWNMPLLPLMAVDDDMESKVQADKENLIKAMEYALSALGSMPLSGRLLKNAHWMAMQGEHNGKKYPGEMRTSPIWIGAEDDTLNSAPFVPPSPEDMLKAFYDLEEYINADDETHPLIKAAMIHYQFEVIHPFVDGNGRVGRLMVMLFLIDRQVMHGFAVSISAAIRPKLFKYYAGIASVEVSGMYERWIRFFLQALSEA